MDEAKPIANVTADKIAVEVRIIRTVINGSRRRIRNDDDYKRLVGRGVAAIPELERLAVDNTIRLHEIAFTVIGDIGDRSAIPFLMKNIDAIAARTQTHVVWGLNALLKLGSFQENDTAEKKSEIVSRYKEWYRKAEPEFRGQVDPKSQPGDF